MSGEVGIFAHATASGRFRHPFLAAALLVVAAVPAHGDARPAQSVQQGETVFREKCVACHTVGGGNTVGPDLRGVTARRDRAWLVRWISAPDRMLAAGDALAREMVRQYNDIPMPNMGLTDTQVADVLAYLEGPSSVTPAASAQAQPAAPAAGDVGAGKDLFTGIARFEYAGPPCMACHSVAGLGALGGGALGPDLTPAYAKFGEAGLASILAGLPFPTMSPIYGSRPLTPREQADLRAYLQQASTQTRSAGAAGRLAVLAALGAALLFALAEIAWRRRLTGVRGPLLRRMARTTPDRTPAGKGA